MTYTEKQKQKLLWFNWNRLSLLTGKPFKTPEQETEISLRCSMHNYYSNSDEGSQDETAALNMMKKSLTPLIKKSVERYMAKN